jgi:Zn-dependent protease with chaperone function
MAAAILAYLLKANLVLALCAAAYYGLLRRLTFFGLNRAYLAGALLFAALYPALPVPALAPAATLLLPLARTAAVSPVVAGPAGAAGFDWLARGLAVYGLGTAALLLRLLGQVLSLGLVRRRSRPAVVLGQPVRVLAGAGGPFSFGRTIYLSEATLADAASLPAVLHHEQAHVRQRHTLDALLAQLATALAWPNPAAWLLRRALLDNLEYLADHAALRTGLDRRAYQYDLLRQQVGTVPAPALAFHFSFSTLKNRITMLNQPASATRQLGRYLLAAPLLMALALGYAGAQAQTAAAARSGYVSADARFYLDGVATTGEAIKQLDSQLVDNVQGLMGIQARLFAPGASEVTAIFTKAGRASSAAQELAARLDRATALVPLIEAPALPAAARSYTAQHYPDYRLALAYRILPEANQAAAYQIVLAKGKRPGGCLLFDKAGNFLEVI